MTTPPPQSGVKKTLNKLDPHCIDVIFHTCWSSPPGKPLPTTPTDAQQAAKDIDVGFYYRNKDYHAAESRLKEALELSPNNPAALIGLAQAQQKLGERDAARESYEAYLKVQPTEPTPKK